MGFMEAFATFDTFARVEDVRGETIYLGPSSDRPDTPDGGECKIDPEPRWYARLSAPGYMDCTEWTGGHATEAEAAQELADTYDLCPKCLDEHDDDEECDAD